MQHYFLVLLCACYFSNIPNCSGKVAWINRIRKRFFLMVPRYMSGSCHMVDLPHCHPFASPSLIRERGISAYSPRQLCWLLIAYQNLSNWKKCHRGNMRHNLVFHCFLLPFCVESQDSFLIAIMFCFFSHQLFEEVTVIQGYVSNDFFSCVI